MIRILYESVLKALIRFWDNRFITSDENLYLRMELEKANQRYEDLVLSLTNKQEVIPDLELADMKPVNQVETWEQKRKRLEQESYQKFRLMRTEPVGSDKSTEELESELLQENG